MLGSLSVFFLPSRQVDFPLVGLDLQKHVEGPGPVPLYDLYGVVNHYGALLGGHYTAYVRHAITGEWLCYDDSRVSKVCDVLWFVGCVVRDGGCVLWLRGREEREVAAWEKHAG